MNPDGRDSLIPPKILGAAKASGITTVANKSHAID